MIRLKSEYALQGLCSQKWLLAMQLRLIIYDMDKLVSIGDTHPNIAYLYALGGNTTLALMQIFIKYASSTLTSFQIIIIRSVCLLLFNLACILPSINQNPYIQHPIVFRDVAIRVGLAGSASTIMFYCIGYLPVSTVTTMFNMAPIFIFLIEAAARKQKINLGNLALTIVSFTGVVLIVQPQFIFGNSQQKSQSQAFYIGLMVLSAFFRAMNMHYIHGLAKRVHPFVNAHYSHIAFLFLNSILALTHPNHLKKQDFSWSLYGFMVGVTVSSFFSQYSIFLANSIKSPSLVMPLGYASIVVGFWADVYLFGNEFSTLTVVGMFLTSAGLLSGYLKNKEKKSDVVKDKQQGKQKIINESKC